MSKERAKTNDAPMDEGDGNPLDRCARLLQSLSSDDTQLLELTQEYNDFVQAFERLELAQRDISFWKTNRMDHRNDDEDDHDASSDVDIAGFLVSFLQHTARHHGVLHKVLDFLECSDLVSLSSTCKGFKELSEKAASGRVSKSMARVRQLPSTMQLLRAQEQIEGIGNAITDGHVPIPTLLLSRRIVITEAGDPEYNGVYFCTGSNGNGFVFTKPRIPEQRVAQSLDRASSISEHADFDEYATGVQSDGTTPTRLLRCVIAKRFSNETILWYLSKEVEAQEDNGDVRIGDVIQTFSFWSKLMIIGDATPDICRYPSQTSILTRRDPGSGWQNLSTTQGIRPPVVELLD